MVLLVLSGVVGAVTIGVIGYVQGERSLRAATWNQLVSIRETKKASFERWVDQQFRQFRLLSTDQHLAQAAAAFEQGIADLGTPLTDAEEERLLAFYRDTFVPQLPSTVEDRSVDTYLPGTTEGARMQLGYIVDNPNPPGEKYLLETRSDSLIGGEAVDAYDAAHRDFHSIFVRLMNDAELYDLYLVDADTGDVLYSVQKEADFGTNLLDGPYQLSALANVFDRARASDASEGGVVIADFEYYTPSGGIPTAFLAAPVIVDGAVVAVVAGQVSIDALNGSMTSFGNWVDEGLGTSGESYLVGPDMTARTDSRFLLEDKAAYLKTLEAQGVDAAAIEAIDTSGHSILSQSIDTQAVRAALDGETGTEIVADYRGVETMTAFTPVSVGGQRWGLLVQKDVDEALDPMYRMRRNILFATAAAAVLLTLFALWSARAFLRPIVRLQEGVERLKSGDVDFAIETEGSDEFASLAEAFNGMITEVRERNRTIDEKTVEYETLLRNVLPEAVVERVRGGDQVVADTFRNVSIGYISIDGLPRMMEGADAPTTVRLLNELVDGFDDAAERHGVEKVRTIGDAYLAACGVSTPRLDHRQRMVAFANDALAVVQRFNSAKGCDLHLRIGLASGEVDAGIVGRRKFVYEIFGWCLAEARRLAITSDGEGLRMTPDFESALGSQGRDGD
jgi:class 3 adenylate cyclase